MAQDKTRRIKPAVLAEDERVYAALKDIAQYGPANTAYARTAVDTAYDKLKQQQHDEVQKAAAAAAARDDTTAEEWSFHDMIAGVKDQVVAQFGRNSNEA